MRDISMKLTILVAIAVMAFVAVVACAEVAEPVQPQAPQAAAEPAAPQAPSGAAPSAAAKAAPAAAAAAAAGAKAPAKPAPARPAVKAVDPKAAAGAAVATKKRIVRTGSVDLNLADSQVAFANGRKRTNSAPWRDGGANREFLPWYAMTLLMPQDDGTFLPWLAASYSVSEDQTTFVFKIRSDAVYQDGTPVTAADLKAFWEHGGMPENIIAWGGSMLLGLRDIKGMQEVMAGDTTVASGLVAIDDHTLEVTMEGPTPTFPHVVGIDQTGFTKMAQVKADPEDWHWNPIGIGPYALKVDKETGHTEVRRVDLVGMHSMFGTDYILDGIDYPVVEDQQVQLIMFENGELDWVRVSGPIVTAALDPSSPLNDNLYIGESGGLYLYSLATGLAPLDDIFVRKALIHGQDMDTTVKAIIGAHKKFAPGYTTSNVACHDPDFLGGYYDPDLARQYLSESTYGSAANLPVIRTDLSNATRINIGVATKEYWKDNLDIDLDLLKRETGMPRRDGSQIIRRSSGTPIKDPIWLTNGMRSVLVDALPGREVVDALWTYATQRPLSAADRCEAFQAVEAEMIGSGYIIPHEGIDQVHFLVQNWVRGFNRPFAQHITYSDMFLQKH